MTHDDDGDLPSELEVWADATERAVTDEWDRRLDTAAELPPDLLAWGRSIEFVNLRSIRDQLRAEVARYAPDPIEKELRLMLTPTHTDEAAALAVLIEAAATPGSTFPPREATVALALAVASPWAGERTNVKDRPRRTAWSESEFAAWIDRHVPHAEDCAPLPGDRGPLAYAAHHRLLVPLAKVRKAPRWVLDPALDRGHLARPPRTPTLDGDGRLLALGMLVDAIGPVRRADPSIRLAVTVLVEWFAGPRAVLPDAGLSLECPELRWPPLAQRSWLGAFHDSHEPGALATGEQVAGIVAAVMNLPRTVPPTWTAPPPDPDLVALRADDARRRELAHAWAARP